MGSYMCEFRQRNEHRQGSRGTIGAMTRNEEFEIPDEVEEALRLQDEALALLERLRSEEPYAKPKEETSGGGRRDFRRWPMPAGVSVELHDGVRWRQIHCMDMGVGGARITNLPGWVAGPTPARLKAPNLGGAILVLSDVMWKDARDHKAGIRFEFSDLEERDLWSGAFIDALLAQYAQA